MDARELRIGNYVIDGEDGSVMQITCGAQIDRTDLLNPITLNEEWINEFGFVKFLSGIKGTDLKDEYEKGIVRISYWLGSFHFKNIEIKHCHQLQNLYFALTGQEL